MDKLPVETLLQKLATSKDALPVGSKWLHYKGGKYVITDHVIIELTNEIGIIYLSIDYPTVKFMRPLVAWQDSMDWNGEKVFRFRSLGGL